VPPRVRASAANAGFTLIELAVATAVMLVALLIACDLLQESGKLLHHSARRARDPLPLLATELLRNDLRASVPIPFADGLWNTGDPLPLQLPTGPVVWLVKDGELIRGELVDVRKLLRNVTLWRWRALPGGVIEVEMSQRAAGGWLTHSGPGLPRLDPGREERIVILVAGRGGLGEW
jgi:prepilin-type N-terminal cleavage/methylation domain-containing protein